jgi:hypothetical protein
VLSAFKDRGLKPRRIYEVRELQIGLGFVAADEGISVVPSSVYGLKRGDVNYKELDDPTLLSPIIMSMRAALLAGLHHIHALDEDRACWCPRRTQYAPASAVREAICEAASRPHMRFVALKTAGRDTLRSP